MRRVANKAVILARGLGTRLRAETAGVTLSPDQARMSAAGLKALVPIVDEETLLDLIYKNVTEAGFSQVCLVIGPEHGDIRKHCARRGLRVDFSIQEEALGTADAVLAAEGFVSAKEHFLVINSDNLYPVDCLSKLRQVGGPALLAFECGTLIAESNIPEGRIAKFATIDTDDSGILRRILEKPDTVLPDSLVSMNAWIFDKSIFDACRAIGPSERGEYELTTAVQYANDRLGIRFEAMRVAAGVLDLSSRDDIAPVAKILASKFD